MISNRKRRPWVRSSGNKLLPHPILIDHPPKPGRLSRPSWRVISRGSVEHLTGASLREGGAS